MGQSKPLRKKPHDRPDNLGQTEMGRDMLAQDYILKQLTASLIYPEKHLGKTFWDEVYAKAQADVRHDPNPCEYLQ